MRSVKSLAMPFCERAKGILTDLGDTICNTLKDRILAGLWQVPPRHLQVLSQHESLFEWECVSFCAVLTLLRDS